MELIIYYIINSLLSIINLLAIKAAICITIEFSG